MANEKDLEGPARGNLNMQAVLSMRSSGYYSQRTAGAKHAIDSTLSLSNDALISLLTGDISRFADFGATDGRTSAALGLKLQLQFVLRETLDLQKFFMQIYRQMIFDFI